MGGICEPLLAPGGLSSISPFPVDATRVSLRDVDNSVPGADYINANYIKVGVREASVGTQLCAWPARIHQDILSHVWPHASHPISLL